MTKEKRGSEPELKLWDSPGTTKKYTKNRKTGQLDLLWGEEQPLFDDWDNRMEQKTARARDCQSYSDLPVRRSSATQYEPSIRRRAAVQYEAPARRRPVSPAARRKRSCRRRTRLQKELQSIAVYSAGGVCGLEIRQHFEESEYGNRGDFPDYPDSGTKKVRETADGRSAPDTESILQTAGCAFDGYAAVCALYGESRDICTAEPGLFRRTGTDRADISFRTFCDRI